MNRPDDVAIFWDYENCPVPTNSSGRTIANSITTLSQPFGSVKLFRAYLDKLPLSQSLGLRAELQSSGVSLIDCPHNGRKEVVDKMILVDMLAFLLDNPAPCTIIIISGDKDFAYALSVLKLRRYRMVLVTTANARTTLTTQASICFDWSAAILNPLTSASSSNCRTTSGRQAAHTHLRGSSGEVLSPPEYAFQSPNGAFSTQTPGLDESTNLLHSCTNCGISVTQTAFAGHSSSQVGILERSQADGVIPSFDTSGRPSFLSNGRARHLPMAGTSSASPAEAIGTPPISQNNLPSTTPNVASVSSGETQKQTLGLSSANLILSTPSGASQDESNSYLGGEPSSQETIDVHLPNSADPEEVESNCLTTTSIEQPASATSSPPSPVEHVVEPDVTHSTTPPQPQSIMPDALSGSTTSSRTAGVPAFSLGAMARLQGIFYNCGQESVEPDTATSAKPVGAEQSTLPISLVPQDTSVSTSPPSVSHATAPQTPQPEPIAPSSPDRTACPSPSSLPACRITPPEFLPLVQSLQTCIAQGYLRPLLTEVALQTPQNIGASSPTGIVTFGQNVNMAVKAGIVEMGGAIDRLWISLKPEWHNAQPAANSNPSVPLGPPLKPLSSLSQEDLTGSKTTNEGPDDCHDSDQIGQRKPNPAAQNIAQAQDALKTPTEPLDGGESTKSVQELEALSANRRRADLHVKDASSTVIPLDLPLQEAEHPKAPLVCDDPLEHVREHAARRPTERLTPTVSTTQLPVDASQAMKTKVTSAAPLTTPAAICKTDEGADTSIAQAKAAANTSAPVTGLQVIPSHFEILVLTLQELKRGNEPWPLRSHVAMLVSKNEETDTCKQAGVADFNQYIELAQNEGIIATGGKEDQTWIGLRRRWYDAVPATVAEQIDKASKTTDIPPPISTPRKQKISLPDQVIPSVAEPNTSATAASSSSTYSSILRKPSSTPQPERSNESTSQPLPSNRPNPPNPAIPIANFFILVQVLRQLRSKGQLRPLRSNIPNLVGQNGETYRKAGVEKFSQYIDMAVKLGIVNVGGREREAWVELHPNWHSAMPAVK